MLISVVTLITGILAAIGEIMGWGEHKEEHEQEEAIGQLASEIDGIEERLEAHEAQLDVLGDKVEAP